MLKFFTFILFRYILLLQPRLCLSIIVAFYIITNNSFLFIIIYYFNQNIAIFSSLFLATTNAIESSKSLLASIVYHVLYNHQQQRSHSGIRNMNQLLSGLASPKKSFGYWTITTEFIYISFFFFITFFLGTFGADVLF